jgi:hypothetical protein
MLVFLHSQLLKHLPLLEPQPTAVVLEITPVKEVVGWVIKTVVDEAQEFASVALIV